MSFKLPGHVVDWAWTKYDAPTMADLTAKIQAGGAAAAWATQQIADDFAAASAPPMARTAAEFEDLHEKMKFGTATPAERLMYANSDPRVLLGRPAPTGPSVLIPAGPEPKRATTGEEFRELHRKVSLGQASADEVRTYNASDTGMALK